jgi:hypothetical protein
MKIIPVIKLKDRKIIPEHEASLEKLAEDALVYIYDIDGIEKDKPALCIYQTLSKKYLLWIDSGPRTLGDIVDIFLTGAESITIRKKYYPQINIEKIRDFSENKIYTCVENEENALYSDSDGLVLMDNKNKINIALAEKYSTKKDIFIYTSDAHDINYLSKTIIKGLLTDITALDEAKKWIQKKK